MGTKLGSVHFDVKGNKGDLGTEETLIPTPSNPASFQPRLPTCSLKKPPIRPKTTPVFFDLPDSAPVWLYMTISRLKMTANSTYWRRDNPKNRLPMLNGSLQEKTLSEKTNMVVFGERILCIIWVARPQRNGIEFGISPFHIGEL
jgi:hypothetical protein